MSKNQKKKTKLTRPKPGFSSRIGKNKVSKQRLDVLNNLFTILNRNFFYFLMFTTVFMGLIAVGPTPMTIKADNVLETSSDLEYYSERFPPIPILQNNFDFPVLTAQSVIAIDGKTGIRLYEKNSETHLLPASTTKIVTALVSLKHYDLGSQVQVGDFIVEGQRMDLVPGERITVRDLLYGLLVFSANDAAEVLARNYSTGREGFIDEMNNLVKELGLDDSYFTNPSGLDDFYQYTTAKDLALISIYAMRDKTFSEIVGTKETFVNGVNGNGVRKLTNINQLLGSLDGVRGIKTGWTENARENLTTYVERDGKPVFVVILGSRDRFGETEELVEWIYKNYQWKSLREIYSADLAS